MSNYSIMTGILIRAQIFFHFSAMPKLDRRVELWQWCADQIEKVFSRSDGGWEDIYGDPLFGLMREFECGKYHESAAIRSRETIAKSSPSTNN